MPLEPSEDAKRILSPEDLENLREALADFEAQAHIPKKSGGMPREKTEFPLGIYDSEPEVKPNYDNPLR